MTKRAGSRTRTGLPRYDERRGWIGGDSRTLYAFTDRRTKRVDVHPGGGAGRQLLMHAGPEVDVRLATREEAEAHWQSPLNAGWKVAERVYAHATRKYGPKAAEKVRQAMHEFKRGELTSGGGGKVRSRAQAIAIGLSQARRAGGRVPPAPSRHATMNLDARVRAYLARMQPGNEIDARGMARALGGGVDPLEADYALERAQKAGLAATSDGRWFGPAGSSGAPAIQHAAKRKSPAQLDREIAAALGGSSSQVRLKDRYSGGAMGSDPSRYVGMTLPEARHRARYGSSSHATRKGSKVVKKQPLRVAYHLQLSPSELSAVEFARGR